MSYIIRLRRGTAEEWQDANPVLSSGEPGVETDTGFLKIGDGSTAWNSLSYATVTENYITTQLSEIVGSAPGALNTLDELAAALNDDANFATTITTELATKLEVVEHGAVAGTSRPSGAARVYWIGSVTPSNAVAGDLFFDTSGS